MKNFILFPLLALVLLSGCKSNSFMTQRYTHLGHSPNKHNNTEATSGKTKEVKTAGHQEIVYVKEQPQAPETSVSLDATDNNLNKQSAAPASPNRFIAPFLRAGNTAVSLVKAEVKKTGEQKLKPKKTFKEKIQRAAGLFDTLFKIVLFAIILAILVAIIIIIILT